MPQKIWIFWIPLLFLGLVSFFAYPVAANSPAQVAYQTPTAGPDGRVLYVVENGDSCLRIQLLTGVTIDTLRTLNKLDQACTISPGQKLLLMVITPVATPTINPKITTTPLLPSPTPYKGNGKICVFLYNDINGNAVHETTENSIAGGAVSVTNKDGSVSKTQNTTDSADPLCMDVPEGDYSVSMGIPGGYNPTVSMNAEVHVQAGDQAILEFGAQTSTKAVEPTPGSTGGDGGTPVPNNTMLALFGGLLVVLGIGLGIYVLFSRKG